MVETSASADPSAVRDPAARPPLPDPSVMPGVLSRYTSIVVDHGEGSWLTSIDGERYLDYTSGIGVTNTGHAHPRVVAAIQAQAGRLLHGQQNIVYHEAGLRLYERLEHLLPGDGWTALLANSGAEAVEAAVKLARVATGRPVIITFRGGFHGRTAQTMALTTAKNVYRASFEPLPGSVHSTPYPYCFRAAGGAHPTDACTCDWEAQLELLFEQIVYPEQVAAILVEPVIGEGGYIVPPATFLPRLREIATRHGILLIADEVQTGFGRTGKMFAMEHHPVRPDIVTMAKSLAGGMPLSAVCGRAEVMDAPAPGGLGGTYAGNPLAVAAAHAVLDVIEAESLLDRSVSLGVRLRNFLESAKARCPAIAEVRGLGSMNAIEFIDPASGEPDAALAQRVQQEALRRGLVVLTCGTYANVIRFLYPLTIPEAQFDEALGTLAAALDAAAVSVAA